MREVRSYEAARAAPALEETRLSKPWSERPLWQRVFLSEDRVYLEAAKIVGLLGCGISEFWDRAKKIPNYDKYRVENAVNALTDFKLRQPPILKLELTPHARKVCRVFLGPEPKSPEYAAWWSARLVSVALHRERGWPVTHAEAPPVPLEPATKPPAKPRARKPRKTA